jgi:exonuclease III
MLFVFFIQVRNAFCQCCCDLISYVLILDARGQFTYWSQRTFARPVNKGLRLDYFVCSNDMFPNINEDKIPNQAAAITKAPSMVLDCFILHDDTIGSSDHCPIALIVEP